MKIKITSFVKCALLASLVAGSYSCRKMYDVDPENKVEYKNTYQNIYDADAAVNGVYGKFLGLAGQYEILNELRADLMDVTPNAGADLQQVNTHSVQAGNAYADPRPFYAVILNCNDVMKNLTIMYNNHKLTVDDYNQRWSDIGALRSWIYFQLGLQFGEVPYITESINNVNDITNVSKYPRLKLDDLVQTLITFMNSLPYQLPYPVANSLMTQISGYPSSIIFINKKCLLGDLYLWSNDYHDAAVTYKQVMETTTAAGTSDSYAYYNTYTLNSGSDNDAVSIGAWQTFFSRSPQDREYQTEWIWSMVFDKGYAPEDPFIDMFSNSGGKYLVKPSLSAINNWNAQQQTDGTPMDYRGLNNTYKIVNGQPVIMKFLYNYANATTGLPDDPLAKSGKWFLYRTPTLHLRFAEAANRDGQTKIAWALVNAGIKGAFNNPNVADTLSRITLLAPPYDFDARKLDAPTIRGKYHRNLGIRARVNTTLLDTMIYHNNNVHLMEDKIIDEGALELAYEGNRWQDLMRVSRRREKEVPGSGLSFLEGKVAAKFISAGQPVPQGVVKLGTSMDNWFLPFK